MKKELPAREFALLIAMLTAMAAMAIDAMLPALGEIGSELGVVRENNRQLVISALFLGLALGQIVYGPLSDRFGRKPGMYIGLGLFLLGSVLSMAAWSYPAMLAGRFLQGVGAAGPRIVCLALIRDRYEGREMARVMSFIFAVFVIVPTVAPALGQVILLISGWRAIFGALLAFATAGLVWFAIRQPETLTPERQVPLSFGPLAAAVGEVAGHRTAVGYMVAAGLVFGGFLGYLNSAQQIFQEQFQVGVLFPAYFAAMSLAFALASYLNGQLVVRHGMRRLAIRGLQALSLLSAGFLVALIQIDGAAPLWTFVLWGMAAFFCLGSVFGNVHSLAMEPFGHIAGIAAALIGTVTTLLSMLLGGLIGQFYDGTVVPLVGGFSILGLASLGAMSWAGRGSKAEQQWSAQ